MSAPSESNESQIQDLFKQSFKYFKRRKPPPDFTDVIHFGTSKSSDKIECLQLKEEPKTSPQEFAIFGLKPPQDWQAFTVSDIPGFIFLQNPFLPGCQRYWIQRCLQDYPNKPNVCNLDAHMNLTTNDCVWDKHSKSKEGKSLIDQLRWVTFGYHHDWDTKVYRSDHRSPFPNDLAGMTELIARVFGYQTYKAEAAIVNYYHQDSTLGGHTDHSEFNLEMPIISYSFGQSAIFLLGGQTKETTPTAMYLHSGDIIIMGGPSRLAYHALPKILPGKDLPQCLQLNPQGTLMRDDKEAYKMAATACADVNVQDKKAVDMLKEKSIDKESAHCESDQEHADTTSEIDQRTSHFSFQSKKRGSDDSKVTDAKVLRTGLNDATIDTQLSASMHTDVRTQRCESERQEPESSGKFDIDSEVKNLCSSENWNPFGDYMRTSRINVSVRQVLKLGEGFPEEVKE